MRSYPFLVSFIQIGEFSLSLGVLTGRESPMDPRYKNTHLKLLSTSFLSLLGMLVIFRYFSMNKKGAFLFFLS